MLYFPQLSSCATGQFPIERQRVRRTVTNRSCQSYDIRLADPGAAVTEWHLVFAELTDQELAAIEALFHAAEGRLMPFTFVDPAANLLAWSEQLDQPAWQKDPLLTLTGGVADPLGGTGGFQVQNAGAAAQVLQQSIDAPGSLTYCFSIFARCGQGGRIGLTLGTQTDFRTIGPAWMRLVSAGSAPGGGQSTSFGVTLDPNSTVEIFGLQVEAQPAASLYKKTADVGGVYPTARFRDDLLAVTTVGPNRHSCTLDIINVEHL